MPPRGAEAKRQAFIKQAIAALEKKTASGDGLVLQSSVNERLGWRAGAEAQVVTGLADRAFSKLQFDFPVSEQRDSMRTRDWTATNPAAASMPCNWPCNHRRCPLQS